MKIGILTQPLLNNYGGTLQNYALQTVLMKLGHKPITIDYMPKSSLVGYWLSCLKTILYFFIPSKRRGFSSHPRRKFRNPKFAEFTSKRIKTTKMVSRLSNSLIKEYGLDAIIVGSDQVWRPNYNRHIEDLFLDFVNNKKTLKLAYAASFGTDEWEYTAAKTEQIRPLIKQFNAISVREQSGVDLCKNYLDVEAKQVLDPTMLLELADYKEICQNIPADKDNYILAYVLDMTPEKKKLLEEKAIEIKLPVKTFSAEDEATLSIEEWLSKFRDASFVMTDSFHGTVFSILFGKEFRCMQNSKRGSSRFDTLLSLYNKGDIERKKEESLNFLRQNLKK